MPLFGKISRSIQGRIAKSADDNPDGALAKYLWLWQSIGRRPGRTLIPRPIRFIFVASLDLFSLVAWYVRTRIRRMAGSVGSKEAIMRLCRTNQVAVLTIIGGGAVSVLLTVSFLVLSDDAPAPDPVVRVGAVVIDSIDVEGNIRQSDSTIIAMSGLDPDSSYIIVDMRQSSMRANFRVLTDKDVDIDDHLIMIVDEQPQAQVRGPSNRVLSIKAGEMMISEGFFYRILDVPYLVEVVAVNSLSGS